MGGVANNLNNSNNVDNIYAALSQRINNVEQKLLQIEYNNKYNNNNNNNSQTHSGGHYDHKRYNSDNKDIDTNCKIM